MEVMDQTADDTHDGQVMDLIVQEVEMGFFEQYLNADGDLDGCKKNGCTRINFCSCDCNHNPCIFVIL